MPHFVIEQHISNVSTVEFEHDSANARRAAEQLAPRGTHVPYVRSLSWPDHETCCHLYRADTIDAVRGAPRNAELPFEPIGEAITTTGDAA